MRKRLFSFLDSIRDALVRLLISVAGVLFIALATVVLLDPNSVRDFIADISLIWRLLLLTAIYAIAGLIIYQEFVLGGRSKSKGLRVKGGENTEVEVSAVQKQVKSAVQKINGVGDVDATVKAVRGKADIHLSVTMQHESINIPDKQREISRILSQLVEKQLGLRFAEKPHIELTFSDSATSAKPSTPAETEPESRNRVWNRSERKTESSEAKPAATPPVAPTQPESNDASLEDVKAAKPSNPLEADTSDDDEDPEFWSFLESASDKKDGKSED